MLITALLLIAKSTFKLTMHTISSLLPSAQFIRPRLLGSLKGAGTSFVQITQLGDLTKLLRT